ncbi:hypothetical protein Lalb_Chr21g0308011 [Lupinus albus]|uniref:Uncharacterized protein n=1 Tax=Lupinus albus TaxID=3870 RepID=A0A6A4NIP1_LUPAL|nr:hypothetical protein Lalb_Chr21g0308011 [Lupinus albus]
MNALASEWSSGCESGWTLYLEHSYRGSQFIDGSDGFNEDHKYKGIKEEEYEEDDLSMVSDASSGPPHFPYDEDEAYLNEEENNDGFHSESKAVKLVKSGKKKQKVKENQQHLPSFLHDTASSCFFDLSTNEVDVNNQQTSTESMLDYSQGFSANYIKGRSTFHQHLDFIQPSRSENEYQGNK